MKEQALKSALERKLKELSADYKRAEEKLWSSVKEAEQKESMIKKQLLKLQKSLALAESQLTTRRDMNDEVNHFLPLTIRNRNPKKKRIED
jgi:hypothetical protein